MTTAVYFRVNSRTVGEIVKKGFRSKAEKVNTTIEFYIFELV